MTDKIKLKADKFVNDKKLKLNYIKPKDLKILLAEFCEEQIAELKAECDLAIEDRDVKIAELEHQLTHRNCVDCSNHSSKLKMKVLELEKENTELKTKKIPQLERKIASIRGSHRVDVKKLNAKTEHVERLQKENAELKTFRQDCVKLTEDNAVMARQRAETARQLTKAKEIIRAVLNDVNDKNGCRLTISIYNEARQFLSEVTK